MTIDYSVSEPECWNKLVEISDLFASIDIVDPFNQLTLFTIIDSRNPKGGITKDCYLSFLLPAYISATNSLPEYNKVHFHFIHFSLFVENVKQDKISVALGAKMTLKDFKRSFDVQTWFNMIRSLLVSEKLMHIKTIEEEPEVVMTLVELDANGNAITKPSVPLPSRVGRKNLCRRWYEYCRYKEIHDKYFIQILRCDRNITPFSFQLHSPPPPLHIGWVHYKNINKRGYRWQEFYILSGYSYKENCVYGTYFQSIPEPIVFSTDWYSIFSVVDPHVSIPLFAYDIFSVIKIFIGDYPGRISPTESHKKAWMNRKRLFFISLTGENRYNIANAYCGVFREYVYQSKHIFLPPHAERTRKNRELYSTRIHDGVVILNDRFTDSAKFCETELMRDPCCLCLNAEFEPINNEIVINSDGVIDAETEEKIRSYTARMIKGFLDFFEIRFLKFQILAMKECLSLIKSDFLMCYQRSCNSISMNERPSDNTHVNEIDDLIREDSTPLWDRTQSMLYMLYKDYLGLYYRFLEKDCPGIKHGALVEKSAKEFYQRGKKLISRLMNQAYEAAFELSAIKKDFPVHKIDDKKYQYLYMSMYLFCTYLGNFDPDLAVNLISQTQQVLRDLSQPAIDLQTEIMRYLSDEIEKGRIILSRSAFDNQATGWYDNRKDLIYLPENLFYEKWASDWTKTHGKAFPFTKAVTFLKLREAGLLLASPSQVKGNYVKYWSEIAVDPVGAGPQPKRKVLKLKVDSSRLSAQAQRKLEELSKIHVPRRSRSE